MASDRNLIRFDWAMKRLLRNKANYVVLEGFLSELFKFDITIMELPESESNRQSFDDKLNRIDIVAKTSNDEIVLIELQIAEETDYFHRMLYGVSKAISENIKIGEAYIKVKKVYSVSIVYFELGQGDDYVYHGTTEFTGIHEHDVLKLSDKQKSILKQSAVHEIFPEYYIIKVNTFNDLAKDTLDQWIYYFKHNEILDSFKAKGLIEAKEVLKSDRMTAQEKKAYEGHLENMRYEKSMIESSIGIGLLEGEKIGIEKGEKIGIEKGEKIGIEKGKYLTALEALRSGLEAKIISTITKLSVDTIEKLKRLLEKYGDKAEDHFGEIG